MDQTMREPHPPPALLYSQALNREGTPHAGYRFGARGTHTSRTLMFSELSGALLSTPANASRADYASAIIEGNCLGKSTAATRRLTNQRLGELYALEPKVPV